MTGPPYESGLPKEPAPDDPTDKWLDEAQTNTDPGQTCEHGLRSMMFRSELDHWEGLACGVCADRHLEKEMQEDWGLCPACGEREADRHWPEDPRPEKVDGRLVFVKTVCRYRCSECGV